MKSPPDAWFLRADAGPSERPALASRNQASGYRTVLRTALSLALLLAITPRVALAHSGRPLAPHDAWGAWTWEPVVVLALGAWAALYGRGLAALWRRAGVGAGVSRGEAAAFAAGWLTLAAALVSPLHAIGGVLFSAHMVQHELLVAVAAPLLVLGRPLVAAVWGLPPSWRGTAGDVGRQPLVHGASGSLTHPAVATALHGAALWVGHVPAFYALTLRSELAHAVQHASFLGTALLFWWAVLSPRARGTRAGTGILCLFVTTLHTGALGALIAVSERLWVPAYAATTGPWGLMPLEDQQLAGVLMWVPGSVAYVAAALWLFTCWLRESGRRVEAREAHERARAAALAAAPLLVLVLMLAGCTSETRRAEAREAAYLTGGDPERGRVAIRTYGCATCHTVPGVPGADALVGPPLTGFAERAYVAGVLPNSPANVVRWIRHPREVDSLTAMPDMGVGERDARDLAAYLYTLH
ncbi:MAG TPA: cytochrome c oxidase assembly protein [Gemmatimonadaceae bacterium]|nr:cytochrome c oxidase assembly protein [Gemmatimonadaceae bacterium]